MPYQMIWIVPKRVVLTRFSGHISHEELLLFISEVEAATKSTDRPIYHISDSLELTGVGLSLMALQKLVKSLPMFKGLGWQVDINTHGLNKMLASLSSQFAGVRSRTVHTLDEAVDFLKMVDVTLEDETWTLPEAAPSAKPDTPKA